MGSLVPEPRIDVNGRVVIRHVRPNSNPAGNQPVAPSAASGHLSDSHRALIGIVNNTLRDYTDMRSYSPIRDIGAVGGRGAVEAYFRNISRGTAEACLDRILSSEIDEGYSSLLVSAVHTREDNDVLDDITFLYDPDDDVLSDRLWNDELQIAENHLYLRAITAGIRSYEKWGLALPERFRTAQKEDRDRVQSLCSATIFVESVIKDYESLAMVGKPGQDVISIALNDRKVFNEIVTHPDDINEIIDLILERGCDGEAIASYFSEKPPLRKGIL